MRVLIAFSFLLLPGLLSGQTTVPDSLGSYSSLAGFNLFGSTIIKTDSGIYITETSRLGCKDVITKTLFYPYPRTQTAEPSRQEQVYIAKQEQKTKIKLLTVHGNISYDFYYRSAIDTPIRQSDFRQHTERVSLELMVKEKYPFKVAFTARQSNSPYFRNYFDPNLQFDRYAYNKNLKQALLNKLNNQLPDQPDLKMAEAALQQELAKYNKLKRWTESPMTLQRVIEDREKSLGNDKNSVPQNAGELQNVKLLQSVGARKDSLMAKGDGLRNKADSIQRKATSFYEREKERLDSMADKVKALQKRVDSIRGSLQKRIATVRQKINSASSQKELEKIARAYGISVDKNGQSQKLLSSMKKFSIGRSILNYTELTAQNITITGLNAEYNSSFYGAIAVGKIDFRFRDFYQRNSKNDSRNNQYIVLARVGVGEIEKRALIFSVFQGRKNTAGYSLSDSVKNYVNILGYSIEAIYKKDAFTSLSAEFAKSTKPVSGNVTTNDNSKSLWKYGDRSNMGINIKAQTIIPETKTRLSGFYRKTGQHYQSFSLFSYNTDQTAWLMRFDQDFIKRKITLTGMLRRNDFTNPFTDKTFKTSTVFKTVMLNVRFPKYPSLSLGYYPGTQLYFVDNERVRENAYYILNGSVVYSYYLRDVGMNTSFIYNRYTNQASDSGFVLYKGLNYYAAQSFFLKRLQLQGGYSYTKQPELEFYTLETSAEYSFRDILKLGAGAKYNKVNGGKNYWGSRIQLTAGLRQFGSVQLQYEKSYLPTIQQNLYPVEIGRLSYYKNF